MIIHGNPPLPVELFRGASAVRQLNRTNGKRVKMSGPDGLVCLGLEPLGFMHVLAKGYIDKYN